MTMPQIQQGSTNTDNGTMLAQILVEQGKQGTQLAVISEQLKAVGDHETRIRGLEHFRFTSVGIALGISATFSALGTWVGLIISHHG